MGSHTDKFNIAIDRVYSTNRSSKLNHQSSTTVADLQPNARYVEIAYTTVHNFRQVNMLQKIGVRDFRDNLAKYLSSSAPVAILRHGQTVGYFFPTQLQPAESEQESLKRAAAALDALLLYLLLCLHPLNLMNWQSRITIDPNISIGKPTIKGTRLAVEFIIDLLAQGWSTAEILRNYPGIAIEDIQACLS